MSFVLTGKINLRDLIPGVVLTIIVGLVALFISEHYGVPAMLMALLLGIAVEFLYAETKCRAGIDFVSTSILRIGVALIGLRIAFSDIAYLGWETAILLITAVASTILFGIAISKWIGMPKYFGVLSGGAVGICGASAALAISAALPQDEETQRNTLLTVIGVTILSTLAMILYPIIANVLHFDTIETSIFLGGTIHDVAQVIGAGYTVSNETGNLATLTKLVRVSFLVPVIIILISIIKAKSRKNTNIEKQSSTFPSFLIAFIILMAINSLIKIPQEVSQGINQFSKFALIISISAIGMKSNLRSLLDVGLQPIAIMVAETIWIAGFFIIYLLIQQ